MTNIWPLQRDCMSFYGNPAKPGWLQANTVPVTCPWTLHVGSTPTTHITIHKKCAESLAAVLAAVWEAVGKDEAKIRELRYDRYDGSYNFRPKRNSTSLSMHAFAAAIDWDAADNPFHSSRHLFTHDSPLIAKFRDQGWIWGGDWSPGSQDAMHVQAARIHP